MQKSNLITMCTAVVIPLLCLLVSVSMASADAGQRIKMVCSFADTVKHQDRHEIIYIIDEKNGNLVIKDSLGNGIDFTPTVTKKEITMTSRFAHQPVQLVYKINRATGNFAGYLKFSGRLQPKYTGYCKLF